jgi:chemotaxis protein MotA
MPSAILVVVGGSIAATAAGTNGKTLSRLPELTIKAFSGNNFDIDKIQKDIIEIAIKVRRDGILTLEDRIESIEPPFLRKMLYLVLDGVDKETYLNIAESELAYLTERHEQNIDIFRRIGGFSPTMGVMGTIMALITTLATSSDEPEQMIRRIAFAFITTLWGIFTANLIWLPLADKLQNLHNEEMLHSQMIIDGVYGIVGGENPRIVRSRLASALPVSDQQIFIDKRNILRR